MNVLVTGGAGFIGSHFIDLLLSTGTKESHQVLCLDLLTYAGRLQNIAQHEGNAHFEFVQGDIGDQALVSDLLSKQAIDWVVNFAAETHVDRSIEGPDAFIQTNIVGTHELLKASFNYFKQLESDKKDRFRLLHISTDEVYGSLGPDDPAFTEETPYAPNSPYSASKAASDHLVRAYHHTYGLPTLITNCSNNYGPRQHPEKLIPLMISNAVAGKPLPIYGDGLNVRDWLYVEDHCKAVLEVLEQGLIGETYNIGGNCEMTNMEIVDTICSALNEMKPRQNESNYLELKSYVEDRLGHDKRYAIDTSKIESDFQWKPVKGFKDRIIETIKSYL